MINVDVCFSHGRCFLVDVILWGERIVWDGDAGTWTEIEEYPRWDFRLCDLFLSVFHVLSIEIWEDTEIVRSQPFSGEGEFDLIFKINFDKKKSEKKKKKKNLRSVSTVFCIWRSWTQIYCFRFPFICFSCFFSSFRWLLSFLQKALLDFIFRMRLDNVGSIGGNRCEAFNSDRVSKISKLFFSKCCIILSWQFITNHYFSFSSPCLSLLIFFIFLQKPSAWGRM